jgi:hypothetical protein
LPALERRSKLSGSRFSEKVCSKKKLERDDDKVFQLQRGSAQMAHCPWLTKT